MRQIPQSRTRTAKDIDWRSVREKLERTFANSQEAMRSSPHRAREILDERALKLARPLADLRENDAMLDLLTFILANERFGIETHYVREIIRFTEFTPVPGVPEFIIGVTNLRGEIVLVVDLRLFLGLRSKGLTDRSRVVVCGDATIEFGIVADSVQSVTRLPVANFLAESVFEGKRGQNCVRGITRDALIVLDGSALISDRRLFMDEASSDQPTHLKRRT